MNDFTRPAQEATDSCVTASEAPDYPSPAYGVSVTAGASRPITIRDKGAGISEPPAMALELGQALELASQLIRAVGRWESWN